MDAGEAVLVPIQASLIELATKYEIEAQEHRENRKEEERCVFLIPSDRPQLKTMARKAKPAASVATRNPSRAATKPPPPKTEYSVEV